MSDEAWDQIYRPLTEKNTASILVTLIRPKSRGQIRLKSTDPEDHPLIDPRYYSHPNDIQVMMEGEKRFLPFTPDELLIFEGCV